MAGAETPKSPSRWSLPKFGDKPNEEFWNEFDQPKPEEAHLMANSHRNLQVCVYGAEGEIGAKVAEKLAMNKHVGEIRLWQADDRSKRTREDVMADLKLMETNAVVKCPEKLYQCLGGKECWAEFIHGAKVTDGGSAAACPHNDYHVYLATHEYGCGRVQKTSTKAMADGTNPATWIGSRGIDLIMVCIDDDPEDKTEDAKFERNKTKAATIVKACAEQFCQDTTIGLCVNPVSRIIPLMCKIYDDENIGKEKDEELLYTARICGVMGGAITVANKVMQDYIRTIDPPIDADEIEVPVFGGEDAEGKTVVPLFSKILKEILPTQDQRERENILKDLLKKLRKTYTEDKVHEDSVLRAYGAGRFAFAVLAAIAKECNGRGHDGKENWHLESAFMKFTPQTNYGQKKEPYKNSASKSVEYFAHTVTFSEEGFFQIWPFSTHDWEPCEKELLKAVVSDWAAA